MNQLIYIYIYICVCVCVCVCVLGKLFCMCSVLSILSRRLRYLCKGFKSYSFLARLLKSFAETLELDSFDMYLF